MLPSQKSFAQESCFRCATGACTSFAPSSVEGEALYVLSILCSFSVASHV